MCVYVSALARVRLGWLLVGSVSTGTCVHLVSFFSFSDVVGLVWIGVLAPLVLLIALVSVNNQLAWLCLFHHTREMVSPNAKTVSVPWIKFSLRFSVLASFSARARPRVSVSL